MKMIRFLLLCVTSITMAQYTSFVNPFIGTGGHGHTYPGATAPFGMVQLSPDTRIDGSWDGCSGYHYSDSFIYGFSHTHLSGTGVSDYGDIMIMPIMGKPSFIPSEYGSPFTHATEKASAGYYEVFLEKPQVKTRLTTSTRVGFHEYTFNKAGEANFIIDLNHRDKLIEGEIRIINSRTLGIFRRSDAWAKDQYLYAQITFSTPLNITATQGDSKVDSNSYYGTQVAISVGKKVKKGEKILVKVALSMTGLEGAKKNSIEIPHWNFEKAKTDTEKLWNKELSKIEITEPDHNKKTIFYTALYHNFIQPNIAEDIDGKYRGRDNLIHTADTFDYYTVFSLWDTFRATHPLYTLIDQKRTSDYINTFIAQYQQGGRLPVWELASNETDCMIGYHSVSVIADAMVKGIKGFDYQAAFEAAKHSAMLNHLGLEAYKNQGQITMDDEHESVSKTLEYAYDDWCIAQMAQILNKKNHYEYFYKRSENWRNVFDWETTFMRPKKNGGWLNPFDPREINNNFTEGNSWQYSFFVPQNIYGMINAYGGHAKFEAKLDEMFAAESKTTGREQADVTGLIGQYAHGNEPSHHMIYLYNYVDKPEKTQTKVKDILDNFYQNNPDGLIGNEDCGQMSAWYILSSMGIYAVTPGKLGWQTTKPYFEKIKVTLENGQKLEITPKTPNYILRNFDFEPIYKEPNSTEPLITVNPVIQAPSKSFENELVITLKTPYTDNYTIFYALSTPNADPTKLNYTAYQQPFTINHTATIYAYTVTNNIQSHTVAAQFVKRPNAYRIQLNATYNPQYHAGGDLGLLDGIYGSTNWRKGDWQGYQSQDFECIINLKEIKNIQTLSANFLQDSRSWILMPTQVIIYGSTDGVNYTKLDEKLPTQAPLSDNIFTEKITFNNFKQPLQYLKIKALNYGKFPKGHLAEPYNGEAFIFIDEIEIK